MKQNAVRVTIVGSCVTRDAFDLSSDQRWELGAYYARSGLASAMSDLEYAGVDLTGIESAFQRRMVEQDLGKSLASHLAQDTSDLVVYDPIDERFDLAVHPVSGAVCTLSAELSRAAHVPVSHDPLRLRGVLRPVGAGWVRLLAALDARGRRAHLRVNAAKWATALDDGSEFPAMYAPDRIRRANEFLDRLYGRMSEDLSADQLVSFSAKDAGVAASDHKWGGHRSTIRTRSTTIYGRPSSGASARRRRTPTSWRPSTPGPARTAGSSSTSGRSTRRGRAHRRVSSLWVG